MIDVKQINLFKASEGTTWSENNYVNEAEYSTSPDYYKII